MPPPLSPRPNPSQEEFVKTQQQAHGANLLRDGGAKRGGEMAAPYTGGLLVAPYTMTHAANGNGAKRGGEMRGAKGGGAFDGGLLGQFNHEQNEQRLAEQKLRSPSRRMHMHGMSHRAHARHAPCTEMHGMHRAQYAHMSQCACACDMCMCMYMLHAHATCTCTCTCTCNM